MREEVDGYSYIGRAISDRGDNSKNELNFALKLVEDLLARLSAVNIDVDDEHNVAQTPVTTYSKIFSMRLISI